MTPDWETNAVFASQLLAQRHPRLVRELGRVLSDAGMKLRFLAGTKDIWAVDYAPVQVSLGQFVKFKYAPDYLRNSHENLITGDAPFRQAFLRGMQRSNIVLDGGNVVGSKEWVILTGKIFQENPRRKPSWIIRELAKLLGAKPLIIPQEPWDPIGHADGCVRFLDSSTVVINDYSQIDPGHHSQLVSILEGNDLQVHTLPYCPESQAFDGLDSAFGLYVNFLRVGSLIVVPAYGLPEDRIAARRIRELCPEAIVATIDCSQVSREGGVLRCVTWAVRL